MSLLQLFTVLPVISLDIQKAMQDRVVTVKEIVDIVDNGLKASTGLGLNDIGIQILKDDKGHTKIVLYVKKPNNQQGA